MMTRQIDFGAMAASSATWKVFDRTLRTTWWSAVKTWVLITSILVGAVGLLMYIASSSTGVSVAAWMSMAGVVLLAMMTAWMSTVRYVSLQVDAHNHQAMLNVLSGLRWSRIQAPTDQCEFTISYLAKGDPKYGIPAGSRLVSIRLANVLLPAGVGEQNAFHFLDFAKKFDIRATEQQDPVDTSQRID